METEDPSDPSTSTNCLNHENSLFYIQRFNPESRKRFDKVLLKGTEVVFGRNVTAQFSIFSTSISRRHAVLKRTGNSWSVQDERSTNGVWVNKTQLVPSQPRELVHGDIICLGDPNGAEYIYKFIRTSNTDSPNSSPPHKILKEDPEQAKQKAELEERLLALQQQLEEKQEAEKLLQGQLQAQQKEHEEFLTQERERILAEKEASESELKRELQERLETQEKKLRESLQNHRQSLLTEKEKVEMELRQKLTQEMEGPLRKEQQRLNQELESSALKAQLLEQQLATSRLEQDQSRTNLLHHFGDLMETEFTCSICTELYIQASTLGCSHTFCKQCITKWKKNKKECPECRAKIKSEARALVLDNFIERMVENLSPDMKARRMDLLRERGALPSTSTGKLPAKANAVPPQNNPSGNVATQSILVPRGNGHGVLPNNPFGMLTVGGQQRMFMFQPNNQPRGAPGPGGQLRLQPQWTARIVLPTAGVRTTTPSTGPRIVGPSARAQIVTPARFVVPSTGGRFVVPTTGATTTYSWAPAPGSTPPGVQGGAATAIRIPIRASEVTESASGLPNQTINDIGVANEVSVHTTPDDQSTSRQASSSSNSSDNGSSNSSNRSNQMLDSTSDDEPVAPQTTSSSRSSSSSLSVSSGSDPNAPIIISDTDSTVSDEETGDTEEDSDEEDYGPRRVGGAYYGGYGRCYKCGDRGHWAGGCPNR